MATLEERVEAVEREVAILKSGQAINGAVLARHDREFVGLTDLVRHGHRVMESKFVRVSAEFGEVRAEISGLRAEVAELRTEVAVLRTEMAAGFEGVIRGVSEIIAKRDRPPDSGV